MAATFVHSKPTPDDPRTEKEKMLAGDNYLGILQSIIIQYQNSGVLITVHILYYTNTLFPLN